MKKLCLILVTLVTFTVCFADVTLQIVIPTDQTTRALTALRAIYGNQYPKQSGETDKAWVERVWKSEFRRLIVNYEKSIIVQQELSKDTTDQIFN